MGLENRIVIAVRSTAPWSNGSLGKIRKQRGSLNPAFRLKRSVMRHVKNWNKVLPIPYWKFREELRQIAETALGELPGVEIIKGGGAIRRELRRKTPGWLVPVDDDDWFLPELVAHLQSWPRGYSVWQAVVLGRKLRFHGCKRVPETNSYAARKSFLRVRVRRPRSQMVFLCRHSKGTRGYRWRCHKSHRTPAVLGVTNRHMASITTMDSVFRAPPDRRGFKRALPGFIAGYENCIEQGYGSPHVEAVLDLHRRLLS